MLTNYIQLVTPRAGMICLQNRIKPQINILYRD